MKNWEKDLISTMSNSHIDNLQTNTLKFVKEMLKEVITEVNSELPTSALLCTNTIKNISNRLEEKYL